MLEKIAPSSSSSSSRNTIRSSFLFFRHDYEDNIGGAERTIRKRVRRFPKFPFLCQNNKVWIVVALSLFLSARLLLFQMNAAAPPLSSLTTIASRSTTTTTTTTTSDPINDYLLSSLARIPAITVEQKQQQQQSSSPTSTSTTRTSTRLVTTSTAVRHHRHHNRLKLSLKELQKQNFRKGTGLMLNVHLTHHGGTSFCHHFRNAPYNLSSPDFACMGNNMNNQQQQQQQQQELSQTWQQHEEQHILRDRPWSHNQTRSNLAWIQSQFRLYAQEYGHMDFRRPLSATNWEDPRLVSVFIMRDPMTRLMASDQIVAKQFGSRLQRSRQQWWDYATLVDPSRSHTDNFVLHKLSDYNWRHNQQQQQHHDENDNYNDETMKGGQQQEQRREDYERCCHGGRTHRQHLESAKTLLRRFTYVLDLACLDQGMEVMAQELGLSLPSSSSLSFSFKTSSTSYVPDNQSSSTHRTKEQTKSENRLNKKQKQRDKNRNRHGQYSRETLLPYNDIYDFLLARSRLDIELYAWSKTISLVQCNDTTTQVNKMTKY